MPQVAALVWRQDDDEAKVLLLTSRDTGRWVLPKGWIEPREALTEAVAREAWEEAGIEGKVAAKPLGSYDYDKVLDDGDVQSCLVAVFALTMKRQAKDWPERDERDRKWVSPAKAAKLVDEPGLKDILRAFDADWRKLAA